MNRWLRVHDLLVVFARAALVVTKSIVIVLMLHLLASYFHLRLFREAGGSVTRAGSIGATSRGRSS
jgi:hypothetical protein